MGFFDELNEEERKIEDARREAMLRQEAERRRTEAARQALERENKRKYDQAGQFYDESGCEAYVRKIITLQRTKGYPNARIEGNLDSGYVPGSQPTITSSVVWSKVTVDREVVREGGFYGYEYWDEWEYITTTTTTFTIFVLMEWDGTLTIGDKKIKLNEWRRDRSFIDEAFRKAYHSPILRSTSDKTKEHLRGYVDSTDYSG